MVRRGRLPCDVHASRSVNHKACSGRAQSFCTKIRRVIVEKEMRSRETLFKRFRSNCRSVPDFSGFCTGSEWMEERWSTTTWPFELAFTAYVTLLGQGKNNWDPKPRVP